MATQQTQKRTSTCIQRPRECKVCMDAGKSVDEYTSHWVKDREGNVICPTLLNQKCLVCGKCGHTTSYCKTKVETTREKYDDARVVSAVGARVFTKHEKHENLDKKKSRPASSNKYALLGLMEQEEQARANAFPQLERQPEITRPATTTATATATATTITTAAHINPAIVSWATRLASPPSPAIQILQRKPTRPKAVHVSVSWGDQCE